VRTSKYFLILTQETALVEMASLTDEILDFFAEFQDRYGKAPSLQVSQQSIVPFQEIAGLE
jgi:hypothetical protein